MVHLYYESLNTQYFESLNTYGKYGQLFYENEYLGKIWYICTMKVSIHRANMVHWYYESLNS